MHLTATFRAPEDNPFIVDIVRDIRLLNDQALRAEKSGMVILGGGQVLDFYLLVALARACWCATLAPQLLHAMPLPVPFLSNPAQSQLRLVKHHVCNANLMRNGADYSVFINTAQEFDGSDAGARPDEAISWGKIRLGAKPVKVYGDASFIFPLIVAQTWAKDGPRRSVAGAAAAADATSS